MVVSIQFLRAFAAMSVAFGHFPESDLPGPLLHLRGAIGVDLFFVISGFIMAMSVHGLAQGPRDAGRFLARRLIRIYPTYFIIFALIVGAIYYFNSALPPTQFLLRSASLIPLTDGHGVLQYPLITAAWTLSFEMFFYFAMATLVTFGRYSVVSISLLLGVLALVGALVQFNSAISATAVASINLEFLFGIWVFEIRQRLCPRDFARLGAVALTFGLPMFFWFKGYGTSGDGVYQGLNIQLEDFRVQRWLIWGVPSALVFWGALALEAHFQKSRAAKICAWLGDGSYSLYLLHYFVIQLVSAFVPWDGFRQFALLVSVLLIAPALFYRLIERPMIRFLKRPLDERSAPADAEARAAA